MNLAIVCRAKAFADTRMKLGWWSYPVPHLEWTFYPCADGDVVSLDDLARQHDAVIYEDWVWIQWEGRRTIPVLAVMVDSNTSDRRRERYRERARQADVLLVDQDDLWAFSGLGRPVYRWSYGVNEQVFFPRPKRTDVAYHVARTAERGALGTWLDRFMATRSYSYAAGGGMPCEVYAQRIGQARLLVHKSSAPQCRSHRFFDALASGCCLLTDPIQQVVEDGFVPGAHFVEYASHEALGQHLDTLMISGAWQAIADAGYAFVLAHHTWAHRAAALVSILQKEGAHDYA